VGFFDLAPFDSFFAFAFFFFSALFTGFGSVSFLMVSTAASMSPGASRSMVVRPRFYGGAAARYLPGFRL
jgi:hypothetical protein